MKNIAIINGIGLSPYAQLKLADKNNTLQLVKNFAKDLPDVDKIVFFLADNEKISSPYTAIKHSDWTIFTLLKQIKQSADGFDNIFYFYADCPLLDGGITKRMFENHLKYFSDYTFADGYPYGLAPEILRYQIIDPLIKLAGPEEKAVQRDTIFELIKKDINSFDLETEISPVDLRLLRASLTADCKRNFMLLKRIFKEGATTEQAVLTVLQEKKEVLRTLPKFFSLQIVEGCAQVCSYCPYPVFRGDVLGKKAELSFEKFNLIIEKIKDFCEDAVINISLWGEAVLHSKIYDIIKTVCNTDALTLTVETSGIGWNKDALQELASNVKKLPHWIISLDANSEEVYNNLRSKGYAEALETAQTLLGLFPENVYVQAVRMKSNEDDLEQFYKVWREKTENIIIQKYDHFCHLLPEKKVTDLSPLKRFPCWHIKRDMYILIDGNIPLCREDVKGAYLLGNIFKTPLSEIWEKDNQIYLNHLAMDYSALCKECDEYYTYNF